ncbi:MAG: YjbQ family protein [Candidatus Aminicenantes bacterium]|nr:YjbQ family protein [Candidatus Aminicenantes bacterium]
MKSLAVRTRSKEEFSDITDLVLQAISESGIVSGLCLVYVPHTTAGVTLNENADPSVKSDLLMALRSSVPDSHPYRHSEGNSPAHVKATLIGSSVCLIVENRVPVLGTWQGIFFCEFDGPRNRKIFVKTMSDANINPSGMGPGDNFHE